MVGRFFRGKATDRKKWGNVRGAVRNIALVLAGAVLLALPAAAQWSIGESSNNMNGTISGGYNGDYGNMMPSSHSLSMGGTAGPGLVSVLNPRAPSCRMPAVQYTGGT